MAKTILGEIESKGQKKAKRGVAPRAQKEGES